MDLLRPEKIPTLYRYSGRLRVVTVKMPEELIDKLEIYARDNGITRSEAIRQAVEFFLAVHSGEIKPKYVRLTV